MHVALLTSLLAVLVGHSVHTPGSDSVYPALHTAGGKQGQGESNGKPAQV